MFALRRKKYYIDFAKKWIIPFNRNDSCFLMSYESLVGEPLWVAQEFIRFALEDSNYKINRDILEEAIKKKQHKYFEEREFLNDYQMTIIQELPEIPYLPLVL